MTFNPGAIPAAVLMVAFGVATILFRGWISDRADEVSNKQRTPSERRRRLRIYYLPATLAFLMAAFILLYQFD